MPSLRNTLIDELLNASPDRAARMQDSVMAIAESDSLQWQRITEFEESFLLDPNSPYRNEELYIPVVEHLLSSPLASEKQRMRAAWMRSATATPEGHATSQRLQLRQYLRA